MSSLSEEKDDSLDKLKPRDFLDALWIPIYAITFFYIHASISKHDQALADKLDLLLFGIIHIVSARSLAIFYSMRWIAFSFGRKPLGFPTPARMRIISGLISLVGLIMLFKG